MASISSHILKSHFCHPSSCKLPKEITKSNSCICRANLPAFCQLLASKTLQTSNSRDSEAIVVSNPVTASLISPSTNSSPPSFVPLSEHSGFPGKLFVGGLPRKVDKQQILSLFQKFGSVSKVILIRGHKDPNLNMGYCFVFFSTDEMDGGGPQGAHEAASKAQAALDGSEFLGSSLQVRLDDGRWERDGEKLVEAHLLHGAPPGGGDPKSSWHEKRKMARDELRKVLNSGCGVNRAQEVFNAIDKPRYGDWCLLIKFYGRKGDKRRARNAFEGMRVRGHVPNSHAYNYLLMAYTKSGDMKKAEECVVQMGVEEVPLTDVTYGILISGYAKLGNAMKAEGWFQKYLEAGFSLSSNSIVLANILNAHCKAGNVARAEELFSFFSDFRSDNVFNMMLGMYGRMRDEEKCWATFRAMQEAGFAPSEITFGSLLYLYTQDGKMEGASRVLEELSSFGFFPNAHMLSMLLHGYEKQGNGELALQTFRSMEQKGLKPDTTLYNSLIHALASSGRTEEAEEVYREMRKKGQKISSYTLTSLVSGFAKHGKIERGEELVEETRKELSGRFRMDAAVYNALILGFVLQWKMNRAVETLHQMTNEGISPDLTTYTTLIDGYARAGLMDEALKCFQTMTSVGGLTPDVTAYGALLKACCKAGRMKNAVAVVEQMKAAGVEPTITILNTLVDGWARLGEMWEAAQVVLQIRAIGLHPDVKTYTALISACCLAGDMQKAEEALEEMKGMGVKGNIKTYTMLLKGWAWASYPEKAFKVYQQIKSLGLSPDRETYHSLMTCLLSRASMVSNALAEQIVSVANDMRVGGFVVDKKTANTWSTYLNTVKEDGMDVKKSVEKLFPEAWRDSVPEPEFSDAADSSSESESVGEAETELQALPYK